MNTNKFSVLTSLFSLLICFFIVGQNLTYAKDEEKEELIIKLEEVAVTATRVEKKIFETPNAISVVNQEEITRENPKMTPDLLRDTAGVFAQKTTHGQGSPFIRGLTGYQTYIQVDGVRLNNSTFRSGPNQYLATIAPESLRRVEVLRGTGSVLYGSGALGGVISVFTQDPPVSGREEFSVEPGLFFRYASADHEKTGLLKVKGGYDRFGFILNAGVKDVEDLQPGEGFDVQLDNRKFYLTSEKPLTIPEGAWLVDKESPVGWRSQHVDLKLAYQLKEDQKIKLGYQLMRQPEVPRYDKIAPGPYEIYSFAPQNRDLIYARYLGKNLMSLIDQFQATLSFHRQKEGRKQLKSDKTELKQRFDTVNTLGLSAHATSNLTQRHRITFGGEFYSDTLFSEQIKTDIETSKELERIAWGRFPDDSRYWDANAFLQDEIRITDRVELTLGGRFSTFHTKADLSLRSKTFGEFEDTTSAFTGSAGVVVGVLDGLNLVGTVSQGFRAPNLNDTTAVEVTNEGIDAPSTPGDLEPEKNLLLEGGFKALFSRFSGAVTLYQSDITDLITRIPVEEAYEGVPLPQIYKDIQAENPGIDVFVHDNIDEVRIRGIEAEIQALLIKPVSLFGSLTYTRGQVLKTKGREPDPDKPWEERIRREPPLHGVIGLRWQEKEGFWAEFFARGATKQNRLSRGDIRDPRIPGLTRDANEVEFDDDGRAVNAGTPGWYTLNVRTGFQLNEYSNVTVGVENILDRRYREHGSGVDGAGINFILSLDSSF